VLFLLFGSSGAGKTRALSVLRDRLPELAIHDFDEIGVPFGADMAWRRGANERWVQRALDYQATGVDVVLAGQTPFGELLATPSADKLEGIAACLLDCDDEVRIARLGARGPEWFARTGGDLHAYLSWAEWMRRHATDPTWRQEVIRQDDSATEMRWERWSNWCAGDPRWRVRVIDTSRLAVDRVADALEGWIEEERARRHGPPHC
jgi:hypothetical protein